MTAATVHTHHAAEVTHPHLRNATGLTGDVLYPAWRLVRLVLRFVRRRWTSGMDWVEANLAGVIRALVALVVVMATAAGFALAGAHVVGIAVFMVGVTGVAVMVGYWVGGRE